MAISNGLIIGLGVLGLIWYLDQQGKVNAFGGDAVSQRQFRVPSIQEYQNGMD